jgi:transcriptional regulator with XRE-family HTH domain
MELIGARLRRLRTEKGCSLEAVAKAVRIPKRRLYRTETGTYLHFDLPCLRRLSHYYGVPQKEILSAIPDALFEDLKY